MKTLRIGLFGLGTLGSNLLAILEKEGARIQARSQLNFEIVRICDRSWQKKKEKLGKIPASDTPADILNDESIDIVVELIGGLNPAREWIEEALKKGKSVISANKALLAAHGNELLRLAFEKKLELCFEAAIGGALPLVQNLRRGLIADQIYGFYGILNGTTNFILSQMEKKRMDYLEAVKLAQERGYAEADPSFDVKGIDAAQKLALLAALAFDIEIQEGKVRRRGIQNIELLDLEFAASLGYRVRPLAMARSKGSKTENLELELSVHPAMIPEQHPMARMEATEDIALNAILFLGSYTQKLIFMGPGAGGAPTAASLISDLIFIGQKSEGEASSWLPKNLHTVKEAHFLHRFYLRLCAKERPGVLAEITQILAKHGISIASIQQKERKEPVNIIVLTHKIPTEQIEAAIEKLNKIESIKSPLVSIRIEDNIE